MKTPFDAVSTTLAGFAALAAGMGIGRFAFTPLLPMMQADFGLSVAQGGWLASANYIGYLAGGLSAVWLRMEAATVIRASLVLIAAATIAMGLSEGFAAWMALRAVAGIASAWVLVFVSAWCLDRLAPFARPVLGSLVFAGVGAGIALAGGVCLALMQAGAPAREAWLVLGAAALVLAIVTWPVFGTAGAGPMTTVDSSARGGYAWTRDATLIVGCYGILGFGYIIPATFVPAMARQVIRDPAAFGWSWPLFGLAAMVSTIAATRLIGAMGNRRVWIAGALVMAAGVAAPVVSAGLPAILFSALCVGGTFMVLTMAGMQVARRIGGQHAKTLMAAMTSSFATGQIAGPLAVSWATHIGASTQAVLVLAATLLVASAAGIATTLMVEGKPIEALPE